MKLRALIVTLCGIALIAVFSTGCKKTIINNYYCGCDKDTCDETSSWIGTYAIPGSSTDVADNSFISGGIAKLATSPYGGMWFAGMRLELPECREYSADSLKLEARVKNPVAEGAIEELDVALVIYGDKDTAYVNYIGRSHRQSFTHLGLYNSTNEINNVPELVQLFQDWTTVSLEVKNGVISTYKNGTLIKSYTITGGKKLGKLRKVSVGFKGVGSVDWVKVYDNADTNLFKEEFNNGNASNVEWLH
jgi:hypothetical protein